MASHTFGVDSSVELFLSKTFLLGLHTEVLLLDFVNFLLHEIKLTLKNKII